jgi:hypothetical protein
VCTFDLIPSFLLESVSGRAHKAKNRNKNKQKLTRFFEFDFLELMTHTHIQSYISKTLTIMSVWLRAMHTSCIFVCVCALRLDSGLCKMLPRYIIYTHTSSYAQHHNLLFSTCNRTKPPNCSWSIRYSVASIVIWVLPHTKLPHIQYEHAQFFAQFFSFPRDWTTVLNY